MCGGGGCKVPGGGGGNDPGGGNAKSGGGTFKCGGRGRDMGTEMMLVTDDIGCCGGLQQNHTTHVDCLLTSTHDLKVPGYGCP